MRNKAHAKQGGGIIIFMQIVFFSLMKRDVNKIYNANTSTGMCGQTSIECSILRRELASRITKGPTSSLPFTNRSNSPKKMLPHSFFSFPSFTQAPAQGYVFSAHFFSTEWSAFTPFFIHRISSPKKKVLSLFYSLRQ